MIRGNEITTNESVVTEIFQEEILLSLYRFSLEIRKAKTSIDLNLGNTMETDDHIVPTVDNNDVHRHGGVVRTTGNEEELYQGGMRVTGFNTTAAFGMP